MSGGEFSCEPSQIATSSSYGSVSHRYYFARKFEHILVSEVAQKAANILREDKERQEPWPHRMLARLRPGRGLSVVAEESSEGSTPDQRSTGNGIIRKLRPDMIRRMDDAPKPVNPSGWVTEDKAPSLRNGTSVRPTRSKSRVEDSNHANGSLPMTPSRDPPQHSPEISNRGSRGSVICALILQAFSRRD